MTRIKTKNCASCKWALFRRKDGSIMDGTKGRCVYPDVALGPLLPQSVRGRARLLLAVQERNALKPTDGNDCPCWEKLNPERTYWFKQQETIEQAQRRVENADYRQLSEAARRAANRRKGIDEWQEYLPSRTRTD